MANVSQQAQNCINLFGGSPKGTIERGLRALNSAVRKEMCAKLECKEEDLANILANI